jgi:lipopolysaccharide export system protein LptA
MGRSRNTFRCKLAAGAALAVFLWAAAPAPSFCAEPEPAPSGRIDIRSDRLQVDNEKRVAEFSGSVVARQQSTVIEADRLLVHYTENGGETVESLEKIVASGNVRIRFENGLAETPEAVYTIKTRVFVLNGAGSRVTSGNSHIVGEKITLRRDEGRITVEGGSSRQVEAIFYPEDENKALPNGGAGTGDGSEADRSGKAPSPQ